MTVRKVQAGRVITLTSTEFIGELGTIFYEESIGDLRISDGVTPGGRLITTGGSGTGDGYTGSRGATGYTGSQGDIGYTGSQGEIGYTGSRGDLGYTGSTGSIGYTGSAGVNGFTGSQGITGFTGSKGIDGYTGSEGTIGFTGSRGVIGFTGSQGSAGYTGSQGNIGYTGSQGEIGYTGSQGIQGELGYTGSEGYTGSQGDIGYTGSEGETGYTGSQGEIGYTGSEGLIGFTGSQGAVGEIGEQGYTGSQGEQGTPGTSVVIVGSVSDSGSLPANYGGNIGDGYITQNTGDLWVWDGSQWNNVGRIIGYTGSRGYTGSLGLQGEQGFTGSRGYTGSQGDIGYTGSEGYTGSQGYTGSIGYTGSSVIGLSSDGTSTVFLQTGFNFLPETLVQDLGSVEKPFRDVYVSTGSLYIGGAVIKANSDGEVEIRAISTSSGTDWNSLRAKNLIIGTQDIPAYAMAENLTGILFPDGKFQPTAAPRMYTNSDAANGFTLDDLYPGDYYYDDVTESIFITVDTGLGYYDLLDLTVRA